MRAFLPACPLPYFLCESSQQFYTIYWPTRHLAYVGSYGWNIEQQEEKHHTTTDPHDNTVDLFDGNIHHTMHILGHVLGKIKMLKINTGQREILSITHYIIVHKMREPMGVNTITYCSYQIHVEDIEDEQSHKEMFEIGN